MGPSINERAVLLSVGDDAYIEITEVPTKQPLLETDDVYIVYDQYNEMHIVEEESGNWICVNQNMLSSEGIDILDSMSKPHPDFA